MAKEGTGPVTLPNGFTYDDVPHSVTNSEVLDRGLEDGEITAREVGDLFNKGKIQRKNLKHSILSGRLTYEDMGVENPQVEQEPYSPLSPSSFENFRAGYGKSVTDIGRGLGQMVGLVDKKDIDESRRRDAPLMDTKAGMLGNAAGALTTLAPVAAIPGVNTLAGSAGLGVGLGATATVGSGDSRLVQAGQGALGGFLGQGAAKLIGRGVQPFRKHVVRPLVDKAKEIGMPLSAANISSNKGLRYIDSALDFLPWTAGKQEIMKGKQREKWTGGIFKFLGVDDATEASPAVMKKAREHIEFRFEALSRDHDVPIGEEFYKFLAKADEKINYFTLGEVKAVIEQAKFLAKDAAEHGGQISGKAFQSTRSTLVKNATDAYQNRKSSVGDVISDVIEGMDDAFMRSAGPDRAMEYEKTREMWKIFKAVEKTTTDGHISPKRFFSEMERGSKQQMKYGKGDQTIPDLARIGRNIIAEQAPDSGTAQRQLALKVLSGGGGALGTATLMGGVSPALAASAAATIGLPMAAQKMMWSKGDYLTKGLFPNMNPLVGDTAKRGMALGGSLIPNPLLYEGY